jgi:hypothetical protein
MTVPRYPSELRDRYREGRLIPFIGAGASTSVTWNEGDSRLHGVSWTELVDASIEQLGFTNPDLLRVRGTDLQILEFFRIVNADQFADIRNWMLKRMQPPVAALQASVIHQGLVAMQLCRLFYTTNFDDFLERSFAAAGRPCKRIAIEAHMWVAKSEEAEIVKFHGDLRNPENMVLSESDYENRLKLDTPMDHRLRADVLGRALLFIGYSFRDWNVSYLFRLVNDQFGRLPDSLGGRRAYIAVMDPSEFEERLFAARNIEVIPIGSESPQADIAELLEDLRR